MTRQNRAADFMARASAAAEGRRRAAEGAQEAETGTDEQEAAVSGPAASTADERRAFLQDSAPAGIEIRRELADGFLNERLSS